MNTQQIVSLLLLFLLSLSLAAQQETSIKDRKMIHYDTLKGTILDENNEPLPFASVFFIHPSLTENDMFGVTTGWEGNFELEVPDTLSDAWVFKVAYIGYKEYELPYAMLEQTIEEPLYIQLKPAEIIFMCPSPHSPYQEMLQSPYSVLILDREDVERWMW